MDISGNILKDAILNDKGIDVYYQPKVDINHKIIGAEALARWTIDNTPVSPEMFIKLADETDQANDLGLYLITKVMKMIEQYEDIMVPISFNVSPDQLSTTYFLDKFIVSLYDKGLDISMIELELTEQFLMDTSNEKQAETTMSILMALASHSGVKIAIDDFGKGHSSFCRLAELPIHVLKLDKTLMDKMTTRKEKIISGIIGIAHSLDMEVVAEGVEAQEQADFLWEHKVDLIQGYYYYRPMNQSNFITLLTGAQIENNN